ncbi:hypothetical protein BGZ65_000182, partial [Modicella reniformis]
MRPVHLDLLGTFGHDVMMRILKRRKNGGSVQDVGRRLTTEEPAEEKRKARHERESKRTKSLDTLNQALTTMEKNSEKGIWTPQKVIRRIDK